MNLSDDFYIRLTEHRGGCRCQDPTTSPPCSNCTNELTDSEASEVLSSFIGVWTNRELLKCQQELIENDYTGDLRA